MSTISGICTGNDGHYALGVHSETETESNGISLGMIFWALTKTTPIQLPYVQQYSPEI